MMTLEILRHDTTCQPDGGGSNEDAGGHQRIGQLNLSEHLRAAVVGHQIRNRKDGCY